MTAQGKAKARGQIASAGRVGGIFPVFWRRPHARTGDPVATDPGPRQGDAWRFWQRSSLRRIAGGLTAVAAVLTFGTAGYTALGWNPGDAFFMVIITVSGVGFGEVHPIDTVPLRILTIFVIATGVISVAYTVAGFVQFVAEGEIKQLLGHQRVRRQIDELRGHTIVAGFGRMGSLLCAELFAAGEPFVLIENSAAREADIEAKGYLYVIGDATEEDVLRDAGLPYAKSLATTVPSDALNVFITLTARQMNPDVCLLARAEQPSTLKKLRQAGANHVVIPAAIGAHRMVSLLTNPAAVEFAELVTSRSSLEIEMDEMPILDPSSPLVGRTIGEVDLRRRTGVVVVAIKRVDGQVIFPIGSNDQVHVGDTIVILGRGSSLEQFREETKLGKT